MSDYDNRNVVLDQDDIFECIEEMNLSESQRKRKLMTNDNFPRKRFADDENYVQEKKEIGIEKRLSTMSASSSGSSTISTVRKNFKCVTGELISRYTVSLNKTSNFLFKFLIDNTDKQYYGTSDQFFKMKLNATYEINLTFENKKIWIESYKECKPKQLEDNVKKCLLHSDLDSNDTISVYAKMKHGFKTIDNFYKIVYHVLIGNQVEESTLYEIECTGTLLKIAKALKKDHLLTTDNALLAYFFENCDRMYRLHRIKINLSNNVYRSFAIQNETYLELINDEDTDNATDNNRDTFVIDNDDNNVINLTRKNKRILSAEVSKIHADYMDYDKPKLSLSYTVINSDMNICATLFENNRNYSESSNNKNNKLERLEIEINQMNDLIENDIYKIYIYVLYDVEKSVYNILGFTKYEIDSEQYESL
ncbi:LEF-3 [Buzura suppressaria nucleopolyhedrovirus]|uniref:LEF-3 n=1 Tax=Buzura suppressaria nuclear polyhedrosis virus TaxID=74320 RepID=W5VKF8_NPVBS|nr:LEF-3 [Buzura suppressaria nucleopolyhedrovirus]AHH82645.1 LEF-3 [Buzura suppressaria nucleopolyhedrovirus]